MELLKKLCLTVFIILFIMSIFKDLTTGTIVQEISSPQPREEKTYEENDQKDQQNKSNLTEQSTHPKETNRYRVSKQRIQPGDTVLSIVDKLNQQRSLIQMDQIIQDFKILNPEIEPHQIQPNKYYLFPIYKNLP